MLATSQPERYASPVDCNSLLGRLPILTPSFRETIEQPVCVDEKRLVTACLHLGDERSLPPSQEPKPTIEEPDVPCAQQILWRVSWIIRHLIARDGRANEREDPGKLAVFCHQVLSGELMGWNAVDARHA